MFLTLNTQLLQPGDRIAAAVSGGADSTALLLALYQQRAQLGIGLSVVHIYHGIPRGNDGREADRDQVFVGDLCRRLDLQLHLHHADVPNRAAEQKETLEEAARNTRYEFFDQLLSSGQATAIATAHTLNDQAETFLLKLLRGAWTDGLGGISPVLPRPSGKVIRPILHLTPTEIRHYLHQNDQKWCEDSTNQTLEPTRNRIRHQLLPALAEYNPQITQILANTADLARDDESYWQAEVVRMTPQLLLPGKPTRGGGRSNTDNPSISIELERIKPLPPAVRRRILRAAALRLGCRLSYTETNRLLALSGLPSTASPPDPTIKGRLHLANGLKAERSPRELRLSRDG